MPPGIVCLRALNVSIPLSSLSQLSISQNCTRMTNLAMRTVAVLTALFAATLALPLEARQADDLSSILAALEATSPDDAAAASSLTKRDELDEVLAFLKTVDTTETRELQPITKRDDELAAINAAIAALAEESPEDAAAAEDLTSASK